MLVNPNLNLLKPVRSNQFLPPIHFLVRLGGLALVGTAGVAIALITVVPYNVVVRAPATVRPSGEIKVVQAKVEGIVNQIVVQENQGVKQGDAIAYLDNSLSQTQQRQLQGNIRQSQQQLTQITVQINALNREQTAESNLSDRSSAAANADLGLKQRDFRENQVAAQTELQEAEANLALAQEEQKRYRQLAKAQAITVLQVKQKENAFKAAMARLERARAKVNPTNASVKIASEQFAREAARGKAKLARLGQEQGSLVSRRVELENQLNRDRQALQQLVRDRNKAVVRATSTGTILKLELRNPGQVVHLGDAIAQILPRQSALVIKARVATQDISQVHICKQKRILDCSTGSVQLRISAYPYPDYGTLNASVVTIAPDATTIQSNANSSSVSYYDVTVKPERAFLVRGDRRYALQAGMDVTADIISQKETVLTFILRKARLLSNL